MGTRTHVARMYPAMLGGERCEQSTCSHSYSETTCAAAETSHKTHKLTTFDFLISDLRSGAARSKRELCLLVLIGTFSEEHGFNKTMPYTTRELNGRVGGGALPLAPPSVEVHSDVRHKALLAPPARGDARGEGRHRRGTAVAEPPPGEAVHVGCHERAERVTAAAAHAPERLAPNPPTTTRTPLRCTVDAGSATRQRSLSAGCNVPPASS